MYIRIEYEHIPPDVPLVASKTQIAPVKKQSIPQLDLLGATILARLMVTIDTGLNIPQLKKHYWTDSYTTLCWIRNNQRLKQYMQDKIHKLSDQDMWRFRPGNPADLPSRGCGGRIKPLVAWTQLSQQTRGILASHNHLLQVRRGRPGEN